MQEQVEQVQGVMAAVVGIVSFVKVFGCVLLCCSWKWEWYEAVEVGTEDGGALYIEGFRM